MNPEIIDAISKLWLLALILVIIIFIILFKNQIRQLLESFTNFKIKGKHKDTELELESSFKETNILQDTSEQIQSQESSKIPKDNLDAKNSLEDENNNKENDTNLFYEMISVLDDKKDLLKGKEIYDKLQESESNSSQKITNEAIYRYFTYTAGDALALEELDKLCKKTESQNAYLWLARIYEFANNLDKAIEVYEIAAEKRGSESERASILSSASKCYFKLGNEGIAFSRLQMELSKIKSRDGLVKIYQGLADLYDLKSNWDLKAIALDKVSEYQANDTSTIFQAGYSYSAIKLNHLALIHLLEKARKEDNIHENVGNCIFRLSNIKQNELDIQNKAFKEANKQQKFIRQFAEAFFIKDISTNSVFSGKWKSQSQPSSAKTFSDLFDIDTINITQSKSEITGSWGKSNEYKLGGQASNRGLIIKFYGKDSLNIVIDIFNHSYAFISQDFKQLKIMFISKKNTAIYVDLAKID